MSPTRRRTHRPALTVLAVSAAVVCLVLAWWQWSRYESASGSGLNLGYAAGGSLSEHLHQHIVPRWMGDANFITIVGETKVMPQLLRDTRGLLAEAWQRLGD